ncbi:RICIN domain-containing protein [Kitasatospora phosalacinea]|uniref:RICIN domain-containing protein n=1 Tax=Kitasatospora phosalacinea TaxID=2065 RepID=UPI001FD86CE9|nr:RICIN domain-containing protein [Kitasatospora phosalacinea]
MLALTERVTPRPVSPWRAARNDDGSYALTNVAGGRALEIPGGRTANGAPVRSRDSDGGANQPWTFK